MVHTILLLVGTVTTVVGLALTSYGLMRQSFADLAGHRPYGEGRYGEGAFGGGPSGVARWLVSIGIRVHLLPSDQAITLEDRRRNAALAVAGVPLLLIGALSASVADFTASTVATASLSSQSPDASRRLGAVLLNGDSATLELAFEPGGCHGGAREIDCYGYSLTYWRPHSSSLARAPDEMCEHVELHLMDAGGYSVFQGDDPYRAYSFSPGWTDQAEQTLHSDTLLQWRGSFPELYLPISRFRELSTLQANCAT